MGEVAPSRHHIEIIALFCSILLLANGWRHFCYGGIALWRGILIRKNFCVECIPKSSRQKPYFLLHSLLSPPLLGPTIIICLCQCFILMNTKCDAVVQSLGKSYFEIAPILLRVFEVKLSLTSNILGSTQPFILPTSINSVPGAPGNLVAKIKLSPGNDFVAMRQLNPIHRKGL